MTFLEQMQQDFGIYQAPSGTGQPAPSVTSNFFNDLLGGAAKGAEQAAAASPVGQRVFGFLAQGQAAEAAQSVFGNPIMLIVALLALGFVFTKILK